MKLDYGTQLSYAPISLPLGTIRKPLLSDIANITFELFDRYESVMKLTPKLFLSSVEDTDGTILWDLIQDEDKEKIKMMDIIPHNEFLKKQFEEMFNFFFIETVKFRNTYFAILSDNNGSIKEVGKIDAENFEIVINIIEQICCIDSNTETEKPKFKNKKAKEIYEKLNKAPKIKKKANPDFTLPNIISSISAMHNSINIINVWGMTVFQLIDQFNRIAVDCVYEIERTRVSVWGDEKKTFDVAAWYKNQFDKK